LVFQNKDKYDSKKYRLVVRRTNQRIICSVNYSTLTGDMTLASADSHQLRAHGLNAGLTNYSAAYCTGLLVARRLLASKGMADMYKGNSKVDGSLYSVADHVGDRRPFKCYLDVGLVRTSTGNRVFGALKGACDGGLYVPHNVKRFPGFSLQKEEAAGNKRGAKTKSDKPKEVFDTAVHKKHIFGGHVQIFYDELKKENAQRFKKQFAGWEKALAAAKVTKFEDLYKKVHESIRKNHVEAKVARKNAPVRKVLQAKPTLILQNSKGGKWLRQKRISYQLRKERAQLKMASLFA